MQTIYCTRKSQRENMMENAATLSSPWNGPYQEHVPADLEPIVLRYRPIDHPLWLKYEQTIC